MGDAKVKSSYFGNQTHQQASTSKTISSSAVTEVVDQQKACSSNLKSVDKYDAAAKNSNKYEQLKIRKAELEKRLNEKYAQLQQVKREEAQLIGMYPSDFSAGVGSQDQNGAAPTLRRKIGTSFKLPENLLNNKEDDINKLLLEKQIQQQISEASLRLANDTSQPKSVRRTHKQTFENAQQKLLAINQNLSVLKKRQQAAEQKKPPATRDDIDLHKCNNTSRFRSNSNSSSMMMMSTSERRNSVKSNTSSNHSFSINSSVSSASKQQQLMVQIPGHQSGHYHSQQISPYSIHSGMLCVMPSGSQSMTPAASAAMVSQLSMLRNRVRHDSISGIMNYDFSSTASDASKMSPISNSTGHHHHTHAHQHFQQQLQHPSLSPQSGPSRLNKLVHHQMHSYSPPPGHGGSTGYVISSPTSASSANVEQAFIYDTKTVSRLQPPPPPLPPPAPILLRNSTYSPGSSFENQQETNTGLGGYWMMLETGEKVWCSVDNRFASLDRKQAGGSMKLSRSKLSQYPHTVPTKSNSMGNFDFLNKQHQQQIDDSLHQDTISVTSGSSEHKRREKVWRETSLDSPVVKNKTSISPPSSSMSNVPLLPAYPQPPPPPQMKSSVQTPLHINVEGNYVMTASSPLLLSPQQMRYYQQKQQQILEHQRQQRLRIKQLEEQKQQAYLREQQQSQQQLLQKKLLSSPPQPPKHRNHCTQSPIAPNQQQLDLLPRSSQYYDFENHKLPPHYYQCQELPSQSNLSSRHPDLLISPTLSASSSNTLTSPTLRHQSSISPTPSILTTTSAGATIHPTPDIQTESPKNVTVVQQGKIQPYKEVTKPFEMSDFYKYSTKYRQKQQQQLQQQGQFSPNAGGCESSSGSGTSREVIQKTIYQPPNPSICQPINYN
ncbi:alpha-protein kinase 1 [Malaya genurostris]|uniref:alpha-protein kinase 1 n=1 Tax=Malaya genurostris TaxID=325434 RepID=UPI0026F397DE|nr:alpha-protein kinase 1 [Malaya genurostris]